MYIINRQIATQETEALKIRNIFRNDTFEIRSISLEKGTVFPEHSSHREAVLILLEGAIQFHIEGKAYTICRQEALNFPKDSPHWVEAIEDSKFLLIR